MIGGLASRRRLFQGAWAGLTAGAFGLPGSAIDDSAASRKLIRNAKVVLRTSCRARKGETVLLLADEVLLPFAPAIAQGALELGLIPTIMDIRHYLASEPYRDGYVIESVRAAMNASDIVLENLADTWVPNRPSYGRLSGDPRMQDAALSGERRWMILQCGGLDRWDVTDEEIEVIQKRTRWLHALLKSARAGRVTSSRGTDLTFDLGGQANLFPILGIVPFYGEVAVTPAMKGTSGILAIDGPTQNDVRTVHELDRSPLRITVKNGRAVDMSGDQVQLGRLRKFVVSGDPPADAIDEVGIVTTHLKENNLYYWSDGTHRCDSVHVALGNNVRSDVVVHGKAHMDGEVSKPTITVDGRLIVKDGVFLD